MTPAATMTEPRPRRHPTRVQWIALGVTGVVMVAAVIALFVPSARIGGRALPGTVVMQVAGSWTTPAGNAVSGIADYTPSTGAASKLVAPPGVALSPLPGLVSPDGRSVIGTRTTASSTSLLLLTPDGRIARTLDIGPAGTSFTGFVWSRDGSRVAYLEAHDPKSVPLAPDGKPYFKAQTADVRTGLTVPEAYRPATKVALIDGSVGTLALAPGLPVVFSPDDSSLVIRGDTGLVRIAFATGSNTPVRGLESEHDIRDGWADAGGAHLVLVHVDGSAAVYGMDWAANSLARIGQFQAGESQVLLAADGTILVVDREKGSGVTYAIRNGSLMASAPYALPLPPGAKLIGWIN